MINALLLDFDGLLMDTESTEVGIWQDLYAGHGVEFPLKTWVSKVVGSTDDNFDAAAHLATLTGLNLDLPAIRSQVRATRLDIQSRLPMLPGAASLLASAHSRRLRLAVVSSSPHWWVDGYLRQLQITEYFEYVICNEDAPRVKPAPDLYLKALQNLQLEARNCLAFEDSPNGVLAAQRAGLRVVGVPNRVTAHAGRLAAELVLSSLDECPLENILEKFNR